MLSAVPNARSARGVVRLSKLRAATVVNECPVLALQLEHRPSGCGRLQAFQVARF